MSEIPFITHNLGQRLNLAMAMSDQTHIAILGARPGGYVAAVLAA